MARTASLLARMVLAWGLSFAPPAFGEQSENADVLHTKAAKLYREGDHAEGTPIAERLVALREQVLGPEHLDVAPALDL